MPGGERKHDMKKAKDTLRKEYDLSKLKRGVGGKHTEQAMALAEFFRTNKSNRVSAGTVTWKRDDLYDRQKARPDILKST